MSRLLVADGHVYDGSGDAGRRASVLIEDGRVAAIGERAEFSGADLEVIDAEGAWVTPGFVDCHTHYEAELELAPALCESVRHGVTTVMLGSCGLSMAVGEPEDLADMFCRVEGVPRAVVKPLLERAKTWQTPAEYLQHLQRLPLGPNVCAMLGHSAIRAEAMGLERSLDQRARPSAKELAAMAARLNEALDCGYLGLSISTLTFDKMDGDRFRSRPTPSTYASWSEYRALARILRRRDRVLQGVPNISTRANVLLFVLESMGVFRPSLRTMVIAMIDAKAARFAFRLAGVVANVANGVFGARFKMQALPNAFDLWVDGLDVPVIEELSAGTDALHLQDDAARALLLRDPTFRRRFIRQWRSAVMGRAYHRDLDEARIVGCPDQTLIGKSFGDIARMRGVTKEACFLDLQAEHGQALRWYTVVGNDRARWLRWIVGHPAALIGFSDAGAHLRNMAYYNFPLRMLRLVRDAERAGTPFLGVGAAVRRLTAEIAEFLGIDAGRLRKGGRADLVVIAPEALNDGLERVAEADMPGMPGLRRLVRPYNDAVRCVVIGGKVAHENGQPAAGLGKEPGFGRVLRAEGT